MRVRSVSWASMVLLVVCLASYNSIIRVHANNSETNEVEIEKSISSNNAHSQDNSQKLQNDEKQAQKQSAFEATTTSDISSAVNHNNDNDMSIRMVGKAEANLAREQVIPTTVTKRNQLFGLPQDSNLDKSKDSISGPANDPKDFARANPTTESEPLNKSVESSAISAGVDLDQANKGESQARGFGSNLFSSKSQQSNPNGQSSIETSAVAKEDLPVIIEKNQPVDPNKQAPPNLTTEKEQPQTYGNTSTGLLPASSARTFDSWTNCIGSTSNKYGTCKNDVDCEKHKGRADGSCMGGLGVCCVMALSCNDKSLENNTFFANPDFPEPSWEARQCQVELWKKHSQIVQIMIEFDEFELAPPNHDGECLTDVFHIGLKSNKPSPYAHLRLCGQNTGQHLYLDVSQIDEPLILSIATSGGGYPRRWSIRIVQIEYKNQLMAPPGCLQYYTDTVGHFRSFNLGRNLKNLYYAICFRIDHGYSGIRMTSNFFGMNGPACRRRIGKQQGVLAAHPHHLVIPPPGSAIPLPRPTSYGSVQQQYAQPGQQYQQQPVYQQQTIQPTYQPQQPNYQTVPPKYKRGAPASPVVDTQPKSQGPGLSASPQGSRTLSHIPGFSFFNSHDDKEAKLESKEFEKHNGYKQPYGYSPSPYYPPPPTYGPPPQIIYGGEPLPGKNGLGGEKYIQKDQFGYKSTEELKYGEGEQYGHGGYGPPAGHPYGPQIGYHHKEIGKFGEKYEHLHEKHEKNHHEKAQSSWWPSFGFMSAKDKDSHKEKEKFFMHHEALFPLQRMPEMPHCEPRYCGANDVVTFPPSGESIAEMCGNSFNRNRGPKIISGAPLVIYVSNNGFQRGSGFDMNYEQVIYIPKPY